MFEDVEFDYPKNYCDTDDPHADDWARIRPQDRKKIPEWMRVYYAMVANVDKNVGRIKQAIKDCGIENDTIFVFTSDHGELFGAHGRRAKNIFYEEAVRVPFLMQWGDKLPKGKIDVCLNTVDIMPTLLSFMEIDCPEEVEGRDLSKVLLKEKGAEEPEGVLMQGTGATAIFEDGHEWRAYRTKRHTYAVYLADGEEHLYDNLEDPLQMKNLANDPAYSELKEKLKEAMYAEMRRVHDHFRPCSYYDGTYIKDRIIRFTSAKETE